VLTAGATVVIALVALLVFDVPAVSAMAYAVVVVVAGVVLSALTLQPAIVGAVGPRLATSHVPWARPDETRESDGSGEPRRTIMQRWAGLVTRHAGVALVLAVGVLVVLAIPVFKGDLRLGPLDNSLLPTDSTQYRAWEIESDQFGPGSTDPFLVVVEIPSGDTAAQAQVTTLIQDVQAADGVASVTPPQVSSDKTFAAFEVIPSHGAQTPAAADLVDRLRDDTLPKATDGTDLKALVTGTNAVFVDLDKRIEDRLPLFIGIVVLIAIVILGLVFRSLAIPLKAAVFSVLTILATYGVLVAFLTFGWGRSWIGIPADIPILSLLAPVFFAVLFGLSNDYEVYLVTRMREEREDGADAAEAVRRGLGDGGRIVIAAALIMFIVFASYMFQPGAAVKQFGFGMAVAILLDAFVTRMTLLPAVMSLGREAMWWPGIRGARPAPGPGRGRGRKRTRGPQQVPTG
jgi:RND superfamily putative drug exporter